VLDAFTLQTFVPLVGSTFGLTLGEADERIELELVETGATGISASESDRDPFSLTFLQAGGPLLAQGTYPMSHPALGAFELFVVPVGRDGDGVRYEAVFA
jgi:hypothetical protein